MALSDIRHEWKLCDKILRKSCAQVETSLVARPRAKSGGLKPGKRKRRTLSVQFTEHQKAIIQAKAKEARLSVNAFIKAATLDKEYKPPLSAEVRKTLLDLNRELTAHGRNLNQIAKHLNAGMIGPDDGLSAVEAIRSPLIQALRAVKQALAKDMPQP